MAAARDRTRNVDTTENNLMDEARLFEPPHADAAEHQAREVFTALMWALSYPGTVYDLPETLIKTGAPADDTLAVCVAIAWALLDLETSYYTPDARLVQELAHTSARALPASEAAYHFYPATDSENATDDPAAQSALLESMGAARIGDFLYPDQSATLVIGCALSDDKSTGSTRVRLRGPGIAQETVATIGGLPQGFWELRAETIHYPLGWDLFFIDGNRVMGLPRTTAVEVIDGW